MSTRDDKFFERHARQVFDGEVDRIDAATRSKLNQARRRALAELEKPEIAALRPVPRTAFAGLAAMAIAVWLIARTGSGPDAELPEAAEAGDMEIMFTEDDLEFLEDVEFIVWLEEQPEFRALTDTRDGAG